MDRRSRCGALCRGRHGRPHCGEPGNVLDFFLPTAVETPAWETDYTTTPSPHHPIGAKGVGESPNVGGVSAFSNAVNDAFAHLGLPHTPMIVRQTARSLGLTAD